MNFSVDLFRRDTDEAAQVSEDWGVLDVWVLSAYQLQFEVISSGVGLLDQGVLRFLDIHSLLHWSPNVSLLSCTLWRFY